MIENREAGDRAVIPASERATNSEAREFAPANKPDDSEPLRADSAQQHSSYRT